jgi:hypothetical protein
MSDYRDRWLAAVADHERRVARIRELRRELEAARRAGKQARHRERLRRVCAGDTTTTEETTT